MNAKLVTTTLAMFTLLVFVVPGGVLQTITTQSALAQNLIDADELTQTITDEVEQEIEQEAEQDQDQTQSNEQSADQSNTADVS
jgi:hypothetical protein